LVHVSKYDADATCGEHIPLPSHPKTEYGRDMVGYSHPYPVEDQFWMISSTLNKITYDTAWKSVEIFYVHVDPLLHSHS
jgi:hypothetical protein